jgi:hypothetical protein
MTTPKYDIPAILALPVGENEYNALTVGQYLGAITGKLLETNNFSPSTRVLWRNPVLAALVKAKIISGVLQKDGTLYSASETGSEHVFAAINAYLTSADYANLAELPPVREWYVVDFDNDYGSTEIRLLDVLSGPHTEEEARKVREEEYNTSSYKYSAYVLRVPLPEDLPKKPQ